jgi:hypothetical protein
MAINRELSQFASFVEVDNTSRNIGLAVTSLPFVGIGTTNPTSKLHVVGNANISGLVTTNSLTIAGIATFGSNIGVTGVATSKDLKVVGIATIETLDVQTKLDVYDSEAVFHNNVRIDGNLSIGGTTTTIVASDLRVTDRDIVLGITTNSFGADISNDTTANHGGIAIASTEGSPLVDLVLTGFSTLPSTYKQMMWVKADSYGFGTTDAFLFNYAVGIGSTLVPNGVRLAVSNIHFTDDTITSRNVNVTNGLNVSGALTATAIQSTWSQVGLGLTFTSGIGTNLIISSIASVGSGITLTSSGDARYAGIITAYKFVGDGSELTGTISGVGIKSDGVTIGTGVTFIDFTGPGVSTVTVSAGIATINFEGGGGGATIDKQTFNVGAAGTNLLTLTNSYTSGNVDVYLNGLKLSPGDFSETSANVIGLTTAAVSGDTIDVVSFRTVGSLGDIGLRVQQDSVGIGTSISTLNFVGGASTFFNRGNNILDVYIAQGRINKQTFNVGAGGTTLLTLTQNYESGKIDVYRNGIRLASGDFSETSANTITLTTRANDGDVVEVQSFIGGVNTSALSVLDNLKVNNIATATKLHVGIATTFSEDLVVSGNARITGILTIGTGTLTLDGTKNVIKVGTGVTIDGNSGIITASQIVSSSSQFVVGSGFTVTNSGDVTVGGALTVTGNFTVNGTQTIINTQTLEVADKTIGIASTATPTDSLADGAGIIVYGNTNKSLTYNNTKKAFEFNIPLSTNENRFITGSEKITIINGNTVNLSYSSNSSNVAICTNPTGNITLNVTGIPTTSDFDNSSMTFTVLSNATAGVAYSCLTVTLNGYTPTIKWIGGSSNEAVSGATTTSGYTFYSFSAVNTVGSASTTANYQIFGSVSGGFW